MTVDRIATHAREEEDTTRWDARLRERGGHPLQASAWGELKQRFGWRAHRLWINNGEAAAQVLIRPFRGLAAAYVPRGPLLSGNTELDRRLVSAVADLARSSRATFLRLEPDLLEDDPGRSAFEAAVAGHPMRVQQRTLQPRSSVRLDLTSSPETLLAGLSKGHRADLRRAERQGVSVRVGASEADVDELHVMMRASQARKQFGIHSTAYYRALWRLYGEDARLLLAEHDRQVVAASLILAFGRQAIYLAAGASQRGLELRAGHLLQWQAIRWARDRGAESYDLWGIPDARGRLARVADDPAAGGEGSQEALEAEARRDPLDGVYRFKKGWGGTIVRSAPAYDRVFLAPVYWFWLWRRADSLR